MARDIWNYIIPTAYFAFIAIVVYTMTRPKRSN